MTLKNAKRITNTLLMVIGVIAVVSIGTSLHSTYVAFAQIPTNAEIACVDGITQDIKTKSTTIDEIRAKNVADGFEQLKVEIGSDQYKLSSISYTWNNDPNNCTAQLKDILVQYTASDINKKDRIIVVVLSTNYSVERMIVEEELPRHASGTAPNWGGYSIKGASTESSSQVYRATLNWAIPTPNDPPQLNCGTTGASQCIISVWTGLSKDEGGNQDMAQVGTDSYCKGNNCSSGRIYKGWLETYPGGSISTCSTNTYSAGDSMYGEVSNQKRSGGSVTKYDFYLINTTRNETCSVTNYTYGSTDPRYAQYMTERPNWGGSPPQLSRLPDFGAVSNMYGTIYYSGSNKNIYVPYSNGSSWFKQWIMHNGVDNESISAISSSNLFTITWLTSQGT